MHCLANAKHLMSAVLLKESSTTVQDPRTGQIKEEWTTDEIEIPNCTVRPLTREFKNAENWGDVYSFNQGLVLIVPTPQAYGITTADRVTKIRDREGNPLYFDVDGSDHVYDIGNKTPVTAPFMGTFEFTFVMEVVQDDA